MSFVHHAAHLPQRLVQPRLERTTEIHLSLHVPVSTSMVEIADLIVALTQDLKGHYLYRYDPAKGYGTYHLYANTKENRS
jgi:hypothetical protein